MEKGKRNDERQKEIREESDETLSFREGVYLNFLFLDFFFHRLEILPHKGNDKKEKALSNLRAKDKQ